jgi:hypothetical protein
MAQSEGRLGNSVQGYGNFVVGTEDAILSPLRAILVLKSVFRSPFISLAKPVLGSSIVGLFRPSAETHLDRLVQQTAAEVFDRHLRGLDRAPKPSAFSPVPFYRPDKAPFHNRPFREQATTSLCAPIM